MQLTMQTDYALRILIYVAAAPERAPSVSEIASAYGVSRNHLVKCAHKLGRAGFISTRRGNGGGLRLARAAAQIRLGEVVRSIEPNLALVPCLGDDATGAGCAITPACLLKGVMHEARLAFLAVLDGTTLADITRNRLSLQSLLAAS